MFIENENWQHGSIDCWVPVLIKSTALDLKKSVLIFRTYEARNAEVNYMLEDFRLWRTQLWIESVLCLINWKMSLWKLDAEYYKQLFNLKYSKKETIGF